MKVSEQWLKQWSSVSMETQALAETLSLAGLEVDAVSPVAHEFSQVVVAQVVSVTPHPDADKLKVTQVDIGEAAPVQIVCGAPNVTEGMKAACAKVGAVLPGNFKIKKAKLRGLPSQGMLCGATELGLEDDGTQGLMVLPGDAPVGEDVRAYLSLDDQIIDIDLTPNRADCLSVSGLARDLSAMTGQTYQSPMTVPEYQGEGACDQALTVAAHTACPVYLGACYHGFDLDAQTPLWMAQRLERSGIQPKHWLVDVTNYVMLELGQPLHAFDQGTLQGAVQVRFAQAGETLTTLDEKQVSLHPETLVIADDQGPIAMAGIMGGLDSAVTPKTQSVFFESAHFTPETIIGQARRYGLHTDASHRFERGVDPALPQQALARVQQLLLDIAGGQFSQLQVHDVRDTQPIEIAMQPARVNRRLGTELEPARMQQILTQLGFAVKEVSPDTWQVTCPSWRFDMAIEADLVEEIGRIDGYNQLPETSVTAPMRLAHVPETVQQKPQLQQALVQQGFYEVIHYAFISQTEQTLFCPQQPGLVLQNPISDDMKVMRGSLLPGLVKTLAYNLARQQSWIRLFEMGKVFLPVNADQPTHGLRQLDRLAGLMYGTKTPPHWEDKGQPLDFYDLKGQVAQLLAMSGLESGVKWVPLTASEVLHPGQAAQLFYGDHLIGWLGALHPSLCAQVGVPKEVFVFELCLDALSTKPMPQAQPISKFPSVQRDLAFVLPRAQPVQTLLDAMALVQSDWLQGIEVFDVYQGDAIDAAQKSVALTLQLQCQDKTLTDADVDSLIQQMVAAVQQHAGAHLRDGTH